MGTERSRVTPKFLRRRIGVCWQLALALTLIACSSGCLILPTPEFDSGNARANIKKQTPKQFTPGKTTRAEVILALGEPDAVSPDESRLGYRSEKICGIWAIGGQGGAAAGAITKDRYLIATFEPQGVLLEVKRSATWAGTSASSSVLSSVAKAESAFDPMPSAASVSRLSAPVHWLAGVDGYRSRGATSMPGEPGQLLLTDTELQFRSSAAFANTAPSLVLAYPTIAQVRVDKFVFGRRLVLRTASGDLHAFDIYGPKGLAQDRKALQAVADFLQARLAH